jgi:hypothetical protein
LLLEMCGFECGPLVKQIVVGNLLAFRVPWRWPSSTSGSVRTLTIATRRPSQS